MKSNILSQWYKHFKIYLIKNKQQHTNMIITPYSILPMNADLKCGVKEMELTDLNYNKSLPCFPLAFASTSDDLGSPSLHYFDFP